MEGKEENRQTGSALRSAKDSPDIKPYVDSYIQKLTTGKDVEAAYNTVFALTTKEGKASLFVRIDEDISMADFDETGMRIIIEEKLELNKPTSPDRSYYTNNGVVVVVEGGHRYMSVSDPQCLDALEESGFTDSYQYVPNSFSNITQVPAAMMNNYLPGYWADRYRDWLTSTGEEVDDDLKDYIKQLRQARFWQDGDKLYVVCDEVGKTNPPADIRSN